MDDWIKVSWNKTTGDITLTDASGRERHAKGCLIVAHNQAERGGLFIAQGDPREVAEGFAQGFLRSGDDPYYEQLYRTIAFRMYQLTGVKKSGFDLLEKWEAEGKETTH